jgi:hypothetical protein
MHPFPYLVLRLIRHFLPESLTRFLLRRNLIIHPGRDTANPEQSAETYGALLQTHHRTLAGQRVLVFGYGGRFAIAAELLKRGATHVTLVDKFAPPNETANATLVADFPDYFLRTQDGVRPNTQFITLFQADIRELTASIAPVDVVVSTSVYEHLPAGEIDSITAALAKLTRSGGIGIHFIDLRDHYFKYPFEMLTFSENIWQRWLNPTSNLNRWRCGDYARVFEKYFSQVALEVLERDPVNFLKTRARILPEFLTDDPASDAVTLIKVVAVSK